jgi:hypothetical protein
MLNPMGLGLLLVLLNVVKTFRFRLLLDNALLLYYYTNLPAVCQMKGFRFLTVFCQESILDWG